jgi:cell division septation protein DedD
LPPARAQVKTDLGAAATSGSGVSVSAGAASAGAAALPGAILAPSLTAASFGPAPVPNLAPAARPNAASLPASALAPVPAASAGVRPAAKPSASAAAAAPAPRGSPGEAVAAAEAPGTRSIPFVVALARLGVPEELTSRLVAFLAARHPGNQDRIYHGQGHSYEVAGFAARVVESADMPPARKILLIFAASLHDVDPERVPDTPARVSATLEHLDADPEARALVADFGSRYGFTAAQVKALIMATDFSMDRAEMKARQEAFKSAAVAAFPGEDFGLVWGRRLAFVDQSSTYLGDLSGARRRVEGLAHEIRTQLDAARKGPGPTDAQILAGTGQFLLILRQDSNFAVLPADLQNKFDAVESYFSARQTPEAWAAEAAPAPARAPPAAPDLAAARAYVRSIAGGIKLDERQTGALLEQFFEENGIAPRSLRAEAVRRELVPAKVAAETEAARGISPPLQRRRAVLLMLAAERHTPPAAIEAALARRGVLKVFAGLSDPAFKNQADRALDRDELERAVAGYPDNDQGRFLRDVADGLATPSGKSVEEIARDGVFAYVDFSGAAVRRAAAGRDPDLRSAQVVFYVVRKNGRWRIGGYRQNRATGRKDAELANDLINWLISGGIPKRDLE